MKDLFYLKVYDGLGFMHVGGPAIIGSFEVCLQG